MTRDEIVEAAQEADAANDPVRVTPFLERFAAIIERKAAEAEREACARVCEELRFSKWGPAPEAKRQRALCAAAIRARTGDSA